MKVFISWSGHRSKAMAEALRMWLPCVVQACDPWISSSDIDAGVRWDSTLAKELQQTQFGILCLTPENLTAPWLLFEAGALSKIVDKANVCPCLLGMQPTDITGPLAQFQSVEANKEGAWKIVKAINHSLGDQTREEDVINKVFEALWPEFEASIKAISKSTKETVSPPRTLEDMLKEVLRIVRRQSMMLSEIQWSNYQNETDPEIIATTIAPERIDLNGILLVLDVLIKGVRLDFDGLAKSVGISKTRLGDTIGYMLNEDLIQEGSDGKFQITKHGIDLRTDELI